MKILLRAVLAVLGFLPEPVALALGRALGWIAWALGLRRRVALANLSLAFPEKTDAERRAIARANYRHLGEGAVEFLRAARLPDGELLSRVIPDGWEKYESAKAEGRGVVVATAHLGNFELLADYCARRRVALTAVTRSLSGPLNEIWLSRRASTGLRELPTRGSTSAMLAELRAGGNLVLLVDQNMLPKRAVFAPFFGKLAATTPAPAVLAARTGAPVILAALVRHACGRYRTLIEGPFRRGREETTEGFTARLNAALEGMVRKFPDQWFWVHRRWKTRPPGE